ncbi:sugar ABC transporter ATP-binding protein [Pseudonocardia cypriaca]|uniref:Monosaccharide ABC transporter ATP-binding protein (CUT2 family) n=1 Tax=Pseudonocardia cypriaca TaxID=882449 RepID=A0A543FT58_9PSEU|nr:sugar ABC transporter ATP-binding protein [Pseudonocardia cypriaca]TQM36983.1 monosaccharide ABC transporter ATP-binding protein (CUT2 family) [Pseudonocardia cypriaca]
MPLSSSPPAARSPGGAPVAELTAVTKRFGATVALDGIDLAVHRGRSHGLVGRNGAGKSTVVGVLTGLHRPDRGSLTFDGRTPPYAAPQQWRRHVACVYQHPMLVPSLTVAENLLMGRMPHRNGRIDWRSTRRRAAELLDQWGVDVAPTTAAGELDVEQAQLVEIAKALSHGSELIVLDEPTARLDAGAAARLFATVRRLQETGATFLLISHYLHEVFDVCDDVTVLRDGRRVGTHLVARTTPAQLVEEMIGDAPPTEVVASARPEPGPPRLVVSGLSGGRFHDVDIAAAAGEVVGIAGLVSSGRSQIGEAIGGFEPARGLVQVDGVPVPLGRVDRALAHGIALVPRDRHRAGLVAGMRVEDNLTLAAAHLRPGRLGIALPGARRADADALIADLGVSPPRRTLPAKALSGGNQQKLVLGRALATSPRVLVAVEPTAGVDIASKTVLLGALARAAAQGAVVLVCTDDLDDLRICHRVVVVRHGRNAAELPAGWDDRDLVSEIEGTHDVERRHSAAR